MSAGTCDLDSSGSGRAQRWRLPIVEMSDYVLDSAEGLIRLVDIFDGASQLIVYNHMWFRARSGNVQGAPGLPRSSPDWMPWTISTPGS